MSDGCCGSARRGGLMHCVLQAGAEWSGHDTALGDDRGNQAGGSDVECRIGGHRVVRRRAHTLQ